MLPTLAQRRIFRPLFVTVSGLSIPSEDAAAPVLLFEEAAFFPAFLHRDHIENPFIPSIAASFPSHSAFTGIPIRAGRFIVRARMAV